MTEYRYSATDSSGGSKDGTIKSQSLQAARDALIAIGLTPIEIFEAPQDVLQSQPAPNPVPPSTPQPQSPAVYFPLLETLRLYAGWLLAWYCLVYAVGSYQFTRELPMHVPYAESLFLSPLVLSFTFGAYLFLLLSGVYKSHKGKRNAWILLILGVAIFLLYRSAVSY